MGTGERLVDHIDLDADGARRSGALAQVWGEGGRDGVVGGLGGRREGEDQFAHVATITHLDRLRAGAVPHNGSMDVPIKDDSIRLGQFLKLANLVEDGAEAKALIAEGLVTVSGEVETRRGRQLRDGDVVTLAGQEARVVVGEVDVADDLPW